MVKNPPANAGDPGTSFAEGHGQYSCLGNPTDRGDWQASIHSVSKESDTT